MAGGSPQGFLLTLESGVKYFHEQTANNKALDMTVNDRMKSVTCALNRFNQLNKIRGNAFRLCELFGQVRGWNN